MTADRYTMLCTVAGPVSRETFSRLEQFEQLFLKWSRSINLAAPSTLQQLWDRHILDSAQLLRLAGTHERWLDLGSGGGFPGVVMAILLAERAGSSIDLVESNGKKAAFLRAVLDQAGVPGQVYRARIEDCVDSTSQPDIVTARALAPLPRLLDLASPWLLRGARGLFHKGREHAAEIEESRALWEFDLVLHADVVDDDARILEVSGVRRRQA